MALSQCLPGPTSSQVGIAIGIHLRGYLGAFISWLGLLLSLIIQMSQQHILWTLDVIFVIVVVALLASKIPTWLSLIASFTAYYSYLTWLS